MPVDGQRRTSRRVGARAPGPTRARLAAVATVAVALVAAGCGTRVGGSFASLSASTAGSPASTPGPSTSMAVTTVVVTTTTQDPTVAVARITANWERFFSAGTPLAEREGLLENGPSLEQALVTRAKDPLQAQAQARVTGVQLTGPDRATVTYDMLLNGAVALPGASGTAVLVGGVWKVTAQSFCSLVTLGTTAPVPGCS